jgi:phosphate transport system protein
VERRVDTHLESIKNHILSMGGHVEEALNVALRALQKKDISAFSSVHDIEEKINKDHITVDKECMAFLAKQGPVAKDLRWIFSIIKINSDLERMGDQCVNIAHIGKDYLERPLLPIPAEIQEMTQIVQRMVKGSLDCFVREDIEFSKEILLMDDEVDNRKQKVFKDVSLALEGNPKAVPAGLDLILIARNLERLGDHATNIAEDVIFVTTGKDIRHGGKFSE